MVELGCVEVETYLHIVEARAQVRHLARSMGFSLLAQARISLATSTLAHLMDLAGRYAGSIRFGRSHDADDERLLVVCARRAFTGAPQPEVDARALEKLRNMVDALHVEPAGGLQVTLVQKKS